jgi:hypothetical protein
MNRQSRKPDPLGGAINQLESLLQKQAEGSAATGNRQLPILDEFVDSDAGQEDDTPEAAPAGYDREELEVAMMRLTEQLEMELETLAGLLKESMLHEFRKEMAAVMGVDTKAGKDNKGPGPEANDTDTNTP